MATWQPMNGVPLEKLVAPPNGQLRSPEHPHGAALDRVLKCLRPPVVSGYKTPATAFVAGE